MTSIRITFIGFICLFLFSTQLSADSLASLLEQGQQNLASGHLYEANKQLQQLETEAIQAQDNYTATLAQGLQGYIALQRQDKASAEQILTTALAEAQQNGWNDLSIRFAVYLGELNERQQNVGKAQSYFNLAQSLAEKVPEKSFLISILISQAKLTIATDKTSAAQRQLQQAQTLLENLPVSQASSQLWLNLGYQNLQLYSSIQDKKALFLQKNDALAQAFYGLNKALSQAKQFGQLRTQASSLKYLATLYKKQQRPADAIKLLKEAINLAKKEEANDILLELEWQLGEIYKTQQQPLEAITAYRQALKYLENIRLDIPVSYERGHSSFKDTFAPLYLELADLLLQQVKASSPQQQQALLKEAQDTIELMKKSELEDYFQSRCEISATPIDLTKTDFHAAAVYPILLPDRLEIIVYTADGLHQFTQPVKAQELEQQARLFSSNLRQYAAFNKSKPQAQLLYQWLISPIKPLLAQQHIDTLIYIPDGVLRLVPLAALYDGKKFLIEDYAVVISPGMSLIAANEDVHKQKNILLAGMSVPGDVINDLPESLLVGFVDLSGVKTPEKRGLTRDLKNLFSKKRDLTDAEAEQKMRELREVLRKPGVMEKLRENLSLPGVDVEVKQLAAQQNIPYLLNESFSLGNLTETLTTQPHKVLHIASHGFFGTTSEDSFIMTYDKILTINKLESLLNSEFFKLNPIDLITLSACQTAEGDDRSPLGISGIAIKSKVHSALGSLWSVSDDATSKLMSNFYQALETPGLGKAKALQQAEISLLKQQELSNPSFWSPFILVGDWQ